jgi:hypothetical protein
MTTTEATKIDIIPGFPEKVEDKILFHDAGNISTGGIYPGIFILDYSFCFISETLLFADESNHREVYIPRWCFRAEDGGGLYVKLRSCVPFSRPR